MGLESITTTRIAEDLIMNLNPESDSCDESKIFSEDNLLESQEDESPVKYDNSEFLQWGEGERSIHASKATMITYVFYGEPTSF